VTNEFRIMRFQVGFLASAILAAFTLPVCCEEIEKEAQSTSDSPSPDGQFAFRYTGRSDSDGKTYDLINSATGKVLMSVAESDPDLGPSARFDMKVLWKPDSKAFSLTATLWKRGSFVAVFVRRGSTFDKIQLPEMVADIPEKVKRGKDFPHVVELNSQSAKQWQQDGSLVVEIENIVDGNNGSITATRTAVLGFNRSDKAHILESRIKFVTAKP